MMKKKIFVIVIVLLLVFCLVLSLINGNRANQLCINIKEERNQEAIAIAGKMNNLNVPSTPIVWLTELVEGTVTTPLTVACETGNSEMISYLLEHGADVNYAPGNVSYPLEAFCSSGTGAGIDTLELLLNNKANPDEYKQIPPLFRVAETLQHRQENTYETGVKMVLLLLENGAKWQNPIDGYTILHYAAFQDNAILMTELLKKNESERWLNTKNNQGETPLDIATRKKNMECVDLLRKAGT